MTKKQRVIPIENLTAEELLGEGVLIVGASARTKSSSPESTTTRSPAEETQSELGDDLVMRIAKQTGASPEEIADEISRIW